MKHCRVSYLLVTLVAGMVAVSHAEDVRKVHVREVTEVAGVETEISDEIRVTGTEYATSPAPAVDGFVFVGWTASEGTLQARDRYGRAKETVRYVPAGALTLTAHYVSASVDTARDGVSDGLKLYWYGDLNHGATSDTDGDGFTLAQELVAGTNPLLRDRSVNGGVWREDGVLCQYNPQGIQPIIVRSEPEGALFETTTNYLAAGEQLTTPVLDDGETLFSHWTVDGVRAADRRGRARDSVTVTATGERIEVVAVTEANATRRAQLYWYGTLQPLDSDTDGDGATFEQELKAGTNPLLADRTVIGGVFTGEGELVTYNISSARLLTVRSEPEGLLFETYSDYVPAGQRVGISQARISGETFSYWTTNGVRVADRRGRAKESFEFAMPTVDVELIAVSVADEQERAQLYWYGSLQPLDSDTDGDGVTFEQELKAGTNPLLADRSLTGGVYWGDGVEVEVDLQGPPEFVLHFDANGGRGVMAIQSVPAVGGTCTLSSNAFERIGYSFAGWARTPDGEIVCCDGGDIEVPDAEKPVHLRLYACWRPNAYVVWFDENGGEGTMADQPFEYGCAQALTSNRFVRTGYAFAGWNVSEPCSEDVAGMVFADGQSVSNLTAEADGVVTLFARWTPNEYAVGFNPGQGCMGEMPDQLMTYDEEEALYSNLFYRVGYTFLGWTDDPDEVMDVLYSDGMVVSNLTDVAGGEYDLYAIWMANEYTVKFNANGGKGVMADQSFVYDEPQRLLTNDFVRFGGKFLGWSASARGKVRYADGEEVSNLTSEPDGRVTLYAVWDCPATTWAEDDEFSAAAANVYDGYVVDEVYNLVSIVQVKVAKQTVKKGATNITATATVTDSSGKKWSYSKGAVTVAGEVTGLVCTTKGCPVAEFGVALGRNSMEGQWDEFAIFGARNGMSVRTDEMVTALEAYKGKWSVTIDRLRLQLDVQAKGMVKVAGNWETGEKVSASVQLVMGNGFAFVPLMVKATKTTPAVNALLKIAADGKVELLSATDPARPEVAPYRLKAGGRTVTELGEPVYLPSEVSAGGKVFSARVAVNELSYPAKFSAKGLPAGLKINTATGVISGMPTKPGIYRATVTVVCGADSKAKKTIDVLFEIKNFTDELIPIEDAYGPYYVGVAARTDVLSAEGSTVSGLPNGLKWTGSAIGGVPTKAVTNTVYFRKSSAHQASATFRVEGMKPWAVGTFNGPSYAETTEGRDGMNGFVALTINKTGKISGKWMSEGVNWTLSATSFAAYDAATETYYATLTAKSGRMSFEIGIELTEAGITGELFEAWRNDWKVEPWKTLAKQIKGWKMTVGDSENVVLNIGANGVVTAKGVFAAGYSASCSTVLIPLKGSATQFNVYLYFPPKAGKFEGWTSVAEISF